MFHKEINRAVASPTQLEGQKYFSWDQIFIIFFVKFEVKNRRKARKKQKHNICCLLLLRYFSKS